MIQFDSNYIFVIDDVEENRHLASLYLKKLGWEVLLFDSGEKALRKLSKLIPSYILLDIKMPEMDGISVARVIRLNLSNAQTKIIGYTAHALKDEVQNIRASGFDDVLIKPVTYKNMSDCFGTNGVEFF
jgi:CheY-like chemotaxis protein